MTMSWKSFIENVQKSGVSAMLWGTPSLEREENPSSDLINNEVPEVKINTGKIINQTGNSLVWWWTMESTDWQTLLQKWSANFYKNLQTARNQAEKNKAEKEKLTKQDVYEDTAKIETYAWVDETWKQYAPSQARKEYEKSQKIKQSNIYKNVTSAYWLIETKFPEYWTTTDWNKVYRTDWNYVVNQPVWTTSDFLWTLQDAYNSVTYAYANDWVLLTPDDLKKAYPEYKNVSDWVLSNFISWCQWDVMNWKRSDIQTVANSMWELAKTSWYTSRWDSILDILSDESIIKYWMYGKMNTQKNLDLINWAMILKSIVSWIREIWAFNEWESDWKILSTFRWDWSEYWELIDLYMTDLENADLLTWIDWLITRLNENYLWNYEWAKTDLAIEDFVDRDMIRELNKNITSYYSDKLQEVVENVRRESEDDIWFPMKNFLERTMTWKYFKDNEWNYYLESVIWTERLAFSRQSDWTYLDWEWHIYSEEQVKALTKWWLIQWTVNAALNIANSLSEWYVDVSRFMEDPSLQYWIALASDAFSTYFDIMMTNPSVQLSLNAPVVWPVTSWAMEWVMDVSWKMFMWALEMFGLLNWWTSESKDKAEELWAVVWLWIWMRVLGNVKRDMKTWRILPRVEWRKRALQIALERYIKRISDSVMRLDRKKIERMIDEKREQIKEEERKKLLETEITEEWEQKEIKQREIKEETKQKEAQLEKEWQEKLDSIPNMFTVPWKALKEARDNFFNDFYEEYKKLVWEENMDADVKMQKDLNDMMNSDPEKAKEFMDTYNDIYRQKEMERMAEDIIELWRDLEDLNRQVREWLDENQRKELAEKEWVKYVSTKDIQDKKKSKVEKKYEKVEKEYLSLWKRAREDIRKNPYRDILKTIFDKVMEVVRNKKWKPKEYVRTLDNDISRVKIQEMIIEEWKNRAQEIMNQLAWIKKKLFDFRKKNFDTKISMDIKSFFTNFLKNTNVDNILSRMFKNWDIDIVETVDENFNRRLEVVYTWKAQTPSPQIQEAMYFLQKFIDSALEYQKDFNWNWKILENELWLYNLRSLLRDKWWNRRWNEKVWESAIASQDLYRLFNAFIDEYKDVTGVWKSLRLYDEMFVDLFDITDIFEWLFNKDWEIRKESRNRLIKIRETFPDTIEALEKLIPWTKEILDLVETWPEILREMVKLAEKVDYKTWVEKHLFRYTPMMATMLWLKAVLPWWLSAMIWAAVWEWVWNWFKKKFWRLVPLQKEIDAVMDELWLTEEEKKKVREQRPKDFEKTLIDIDNTFEERLNTELDGEFEKDKREDNTPKTYDEEWNEVIYTEWKRNNGWDTWDTWDTWGNWGNWNPPSWWNGWGSKADTLENTNKSEETTSWEWIVKEWVPENWDKMTDYQKLQYVLEKYNNYVNLTLDELKILWWFLELEEERAADAKKIKRAKMAQIAFMRKAIWTIVDRLSDAEKEKLRDDVIFAKSMMKKWNYKELQKKIEKTQWFAKLIYTRALYDMMLLWTAPTADVKVNYNEVRKKDIENADPNISASSWSEDLTEAMYELWGEEDPFGYWTDFAQNVFKAVRDMRFRRKNWWDVDWDIIDKYDFAGSLSRTNEQYENFTKDEIYDIVVNAIEKAWSIEYRRPRTTLKSERDKMKVKAAEWKRILEEVWEPIWKESIKSRENIWFSFENIWKWRTRTDNNWGKISVGQWVDKIDWWLLRWRAWIQWKNDRTTIMVSDLAVFDNFPQLARLLPEDTIIFNLEDWKDYSIEQILREDASWKTQKERVELARKEIFEKYPSQKELDEFFAKEYEKEYSKEDIKEDVEEEREYTIEELDQIKSDLDEIEKQDIKDMEKSQVQPSEEVKSEPQEAQAEQSTTKTKKTSKSGKKSKPKKISPEEEAHLFWEDKKTKNSKNSSKEEFDEMYDSTPVEELNIPRDRIDDLIWQIEKRTGANMEVEFSMDKDNKLMAIIRRRPKEWIIWQDWYSKFVYDLGKNRPQEKVMYEMKRIEDEINWIILPF